MGGNRIRTGPESLEPSEANNIVHSLCACARERAPEHVCLLFLPFTVGEWLTVASNLKLTKINISSRGTHTCKHMCTQQNHKEKSTINTHSASCNRNVPQKLTQMVIRRYEKSRLRMSQKLFLWYQTSSHIFFCGVCGWWGVGVLGDDYLGWSETLAERLRQWKQHIVHFSKWIKRPIEPTSVWFALESESIDGCICCFVGIDVAVDVIPTS